MKYHLILTRQAFGDRDDAYNWYCEHYSETFANRWYVGLAEAIESLRDNPSPCHRAREDMHVTFDLYELLFGRKSNKHRILFRIDGDRVVILMIRHSARRDLSENDF